MTEKTLQEIKEEIKELITDSLEITDIKPEDIKEDKNLFEGEAGIQIDSVDALEIVMSLQRKYNVRIDDQNLGMAIIKTVNTIADFIYDELEKQ